MARGAAYSPARSRHAREPRQRRSEPNSGALTRVWPELRVARFPDVDGGRNIDDWTIFLNDVGGPRNFGKGKARSLGSMAVTFIRAKEFGLMLENKYPSAYESPDRTAKLIRKVHEGVRSFVRSAHSEAYQNRTLDIGERVANSMLSRAVILRDVEDELDVFAADDAEEAADRSIALLQAEHAEPIWFGPASFNVKGIDHYGVDGYGVDLSLNEQLFDERAALVHYLRTYERLDTSFIDDRWKPHATFFDQEEHLNRTTLSYGSELPATIDYDHPIAL